MSVLRTPLTAVILLVAASAFAKEGPRRSDGASWSDAAAGSDPITVLDDDPDQVVHASLGPLAIDPSVPLMLSLRIRTRVEDQPFVAALAFFDADGRWLRGQNLEITGRGETRWRPWKVTWRALPRDAAAARVLLSATAWREQDTGEATYASVLLRSERDPVWGLGARVPAPDGVTAWVNRPEQQVVPGLLPPAPGPTWAGADLAGLRGEGEAFQIALRGETLVTGVETPPLLGPGRIEGVAIDVREVGLISVVTPSDATALRGVLPDPLPPLALPLAIHADETRALWVTVRIPEGAAPGDYQGAVRVLLGDRPPVTVPVRLHVYDATLPRIPSLRTSFDLPPRSIARYHNLEGRQALLREALALAYRDMAAHRISAMDPTQGAAIDVLSPSWGWLGGTVVAGAHGSARALRLSASDPGVGGSARTVVPIHVRPDEGWTVTWLARAAGDAASYRLEVEARDERGHGLRTLPRDLLARTPWSEGRLELPPGALPARTRGLRLRFVSTSGAVDLEDVRVSPTGHPTDQRLVNVGFELPLTDLRIDLDTVAFDESARLALDELGMTFRLHLPGLPFGSGDVVNPGSLFGFPAGTPEHGALLAAAAERVTDHLRARGWLAAAYLYPFDEPSPVGAPAVARAMADLGALVPHVPRLLTAAPSPPLEGAADVWSPVITDVTPAVVRGRKERGQSVWTYVSCCLQAPAPNLLSDHPAMEARILPLAVRSLGADGLLYWSVAHWDRGEMTGPRSDPYRDPMTTLAGGFEAGCGDGRLLYPPRGFQDGEARVEAPVPTQRWELLREGLEDVDRLALLGAAVRARVRAGDAEAPDVRRARALLRVPEHIAAGRSSWTDDPRALEAWRRSVAAALVETSRALPERTAATSRPVSMREPLPGREVRPGALVMARTSARLAGDPSPHAVGLAAVTPVRPVTPGSGSGLERAVFSWAESDATHEPEVATDKPDREASP